LANQHKGRQSLHEVKYAHLVVEYSGLAALGRLDEVVVENGENIVTDLLQFCLYLLAVGFDRSEPRRIGLGLPFIEVSPSSSQVINAKPRQSLTSSFPSMLLTIRQLALRAPMTCKGTGGHKFRPHVEKSDKK
jgi:hypothetical protein